MSGETGFVLQTMMATIAQNQVCTLCLQIRSTCVVHVELTLIEKQVFRVNKTPGAAAPT